MNEGYVSKTKMMAIGLWVLVVLLMASGWAVILIDGNYWWLGGMLAATSCATSAIAATMQIRLYALSLCGLIRLAHGLGREQPIDLHALR